MCDLTRARDLLQQGAYTCVLCKGEVTYTSNRIGIAPMLDFLDAGYDMRGFCAADRIVGRAAALLFVLANIQAVYADVISEGAVKVLETHGIKVSYRDKTPYIINRQGDGPCPMERAVADTEDPAQAECAIRRAVEQLRKDRGTANHEKQ